MGSEEVKKIEPKVEGNVAVVKDKEEEEEQDIGKDKDKACPKSEEKLAIVASPQKVASSIDRDAVLARVETEKRYALTKAWEESEKTKVENRAYKKISSVGAWENTNVAAVEAQLKKIETLNKIYEAVAKRHEEEQLEKKKAEYGEVMKNKIAEIHKVAAEKRAIVEAKRGEDFVKIEETASKFCASGYIPRKYFGCFTS